MMLTWMGFFLSIAVLLLVSRKNLSVALLSGSIVLGLFTMPLKELTDNISTTLSTPSVVILSLAMGLFPVIGAILQKTGKLDDIINNLRMGKKAFLAFSAALIGLLPVPGGALLSAPLVKKASGKISKERSFAINIWFRHVLILIYPLSPSLLIPVKMANLDVYDVIPYLFPLFLLMILLGYLYLLKDIKEDIKYDKAIDKKKLVAPITIILIPPFLDILIKILFNLKIPEISTLIAVLTSLCAAIFFGRMNIRDLTKTAVEAKPLRFILIILNMFIFINIFKSSGIGGLISEIELPTVFLCVFVGFFFAFVTGRTQLSASIVIPTFLGATGATEMPLPTFALTFFCIFVGYLISPLHPCISVSLEYFETSLNKAFKTIFPQALIALGIAFVIFLLVN
ncbi:MAG: DUF401 family protein [Candidatus Methanofastidiosia archaeon]